MNGSESPDTDGRLPLHCATDCAGRPMVRYIAVCTARNNEWGRDRTIVFAPLGLRLASARDVPCRKSDALAIDQTAPDSLPMMLAVRTGLTRCDVLSQECSRKPGAAPLASPRLPSATLREAEHASTTTKNPKRNSCGGAEGVSMQGDEMTRQRWNGKRTKARRNGCYRSGGTAYLAKGWRYPEDDARQPRRFQPKVADNPLSPRTPRDRERQLARDQLEERCPDAPHVARRREILF
eukprot:2337161-Rhodomonas_salina.3